MRMLRNSNTHLNATCIGTISRSLILVLPMSCPSIWVGPQHSIISPSLENRDCREEASTICTSGTGIYLPRKINTSTKHNLPSWERWSTQGDYQRTSICQRSCRDFFRQTAGWCMWGSTEAWEFDTSPQDRRAREGGLDPDQKSC